MKRRASLILTLSAVALFNALASQHSRSALSVSAAELNALPPTMHAVAEFGIHIGPTQIAMLPGLLPPVMPHPTATTVAPATTVVRKAPRNTNNVKRQTLTPHPIATPKTRSAARLTAAPPAAVPSTLPLTSPTAMPSTTSLDATKKKKISIRIITRASATEDSDENAKTVALTFDDGPSPEYTPQILAILKENNIHATFCLVGRQVKKYPNIVKQIVADGHKVADHSMNHDERLSFRTDKKIKQEILGDKQLIEQVVPGTKVEYYRAPGGNWNRRVRKLCTSWGLKPLGWSVDTKDWSRPGVDEIVNNVENELHDGGVILMHDGGGNRSESVEALKELIPTLKEEGYEFVFPQS